MGININTSIVTNGLTLCIDPANAKSYNYYGNANTSTYLDLGPLGLNASLVNGAKYDNTSTGIPSFYFNGTNNYVSMNGSADSLAWTPLGSIGQSSFTLEVWVKTTDALGYIISKPWNATGGYNYYVAGNGMTVAPVNQSFELGSSLTMGSTYYNGSIHQLVIWISPTQFGYYLDGGYGEQASAAHGFTQDNPLGRTDSQIPLTIMTEYPYPGFGGNSALSIQGNVFSIKAYNRVLAPAEIQQNFNALRSRFGL